MNEIKCPNCGEVFTVNESQYVELLSQVRTAEFDKELHDRMKQELALAEQKAMNEQQSKLAQKDQEIAQLQSQIQNFDTEKEFRPYWLRIRKYRPWKTNWQPCVWSMKINCKRPFLT